MSWAIRVFNFTRGEINAFDPATRAFFGPLKDASGQPIDVDNV